ncbi:hypothetical protein HAX54_023658 [Datura stramonium]|uniref:Ubiquitin-like domain-containing protein n=1 Tax=Datura stramonium TaxID=4076 RepID=A0ABS8UYP0_DATST|nr:hypothetical protein [Datura stramonium]
MDVFFQPTKGRPFAIEIGYFDTILEVKDKIQRNQDSEPDKNNAVREERSSSPTRKIQLLLKMPMSTNLGVALEADVTDSVGRVKERIHEMEGVHVSKLVMHANGIELIDHLSLQDYGLSDNSEIDVSIRPSSTIIASLPTTTTAAITTTSSGSSANNNGNGQKKLRIMVLPKCGTKKIPIEVNPSDNVGLLRKELQKMELELPQEGYFFIYKQNVMDDDHSFRWHNVCQGDTIEIFNGSVTGGA